MNRDSTSKSDTNTNTLRILFVGTADTCRSPLAAALMQQQVAINGLSVEITSAGLVDGGKPAHPHAISCLQKIGIDLSQHCSHKVSAIQVDGADFILAMTTQQVFDLVERFPAALPRTHTARHLIRYAKPRKEGQGMLSWAREANASLQHNYVSENVDLDIADPSGLPEQTFNELRNDLTALFSWLCRLIAGDAMQYRLLPISHRINS